MAQLKRLKRDYKIAVAAHNLNPENWLLLEDGDVYITIVHSVTGTKRRIDKLARPPRSKRIIAFALACAMCVVSTVPAQAKENETIISQVAREACIEYGNLYGICPELLMAIIERESSGLPDVSNGSCVGLMQVSQVWHLERAVRLGVTDLYSERGNILVATDYLAELSKLHKDVSTALMVYHGESDAIEKANAGKVSGYADWILKRSAELEKIHEREER